MKRELLPALWRFAGKVPAKYADIVNEITLCERYHCLPSQLDGEDAERIRRHLTVGQVIGEWRAMESRSKSNRGRRR